MENKPVGLNYREMNSMEIIKLKANIRQLESLIDLFSRELERRKRKEEQEKLILL